MHLRAGTVISKRFQKRFLLRPRRLQQGLGLYDGKICGLTTFASISAMQAQERMLIPPES